METKKSYGKWIIFSVILVAIIVILIYLISFGGWEKVKKRWVEKNPAPNIPSSLNTNSNSTPTPSTSSNTTSVSGEYQKFIGTWTTDCLVPDPNSPWAEKHSFTFESSGVAKHIRWSGDSCAGLKKDQFSQTYKVEIPENGKINFLADGSGSESMYDIYQISGTLLYFGNGFRQTYPPGMSNFGVSLGTRFTSLNTFLVYKK